ncbi:MAG: carboxypeptidase-like regulatory domain-containing protein [Vicingaceae bacterium]|nr:carboxypeptidase-like regulatory domain-containing protein [Vicingaceae bacterium]
MKKTLFLLLTVTSLTIFGQTPSTDSLYILSGTVVNGNNNTLLEGAHITTSKGYGTKTNPQGDFSLNIYPRDTIKVSYVGFKTLTYVAPYQKPGQYLIKFKLYADSISLKEVEIFPYPTYKEFKQAFSELNKQDEKVEIYGVKTYQDKVTDKRKPTIFNPASFIYDRLFDKKAKLKRKLARRRRTTKDAAIIE